MQATERHRRIVGRQSKFMVVVTGLLLVITTLFGAKQSLDNNQAAQAHAAAQERVEFWQVVSGDASPDSTDSVDTLAGDLRDALGSGTSASLPADILDFQGGPLEYGNVESTLGIQPFGDDNRLTDLMLERLQLIKQGHEEILIRTEQATPGPSGLTLSPMGLPLVAWFGLVYITSTTLALVIAVHRDAKQHHYNPQELNWRNTGGTVADQYKRLSKFISPFYALVVVPLQNKLGHSYDHFLEQVGLRDDYYQLQELQDQVHALPSGERRDTAQCELDRLLAQIEQQVSNYAGKDRDFRHMEAQAVSDHVQSSLAAISERVDSRQAARDELDQIGRSSYEE